MSPSKFESHATGSPTKLSVPNRKLRNQPANRVHDIEFAAEISTSLITQVRNLQALLAEKDEDLRDVTNEKSRLEIDSESLQQRVKQLDESETRYKDENWTLETQVQELFAAQKEAAEREKRLTQSLNVLQAERNSTQRELDEMKVSHARLSDEHAAAIKLHDIELGTARRSIAAAENERFGLQRKIDDLTAQNQEIARAFSSSQRAKMLEREGLPNMSEDDFESAVDNITPEHSPPNSPMKGTTPRHSMLESETLKTSLQHAQRTIQSQRSQLHREKTEKLELKRMLQDARDDVERLRNEAGGPPNRRSKKNEAKELKKYSKLLLGNPRTSREDVYSDDHEWEEDLDRSPRVFGSPTSARGSPSPTRRGGISSDQFETANETSDAAFETANERGTETEDFQTGAEDFSGSESEVTETESQSKGVRRTRSNITAVNFRTHRPRESFDSTASTSNDEDLFSDEPGVPSSAPPRMRLRVSRGLLRRPRQTSEEPPAIGSSPPATNSTSGTPRQGGQSLFAELADFDGSGDESPDGTPSRTLFKTPSSTSSSGRGLRSIPSIQKFGMADAAAVTDPSKSGADTFVRTPITAVPRPEMVDSGTMTVDMERPDLTESAMGMHLSESINSDQAKRISSYSDSAAQYDPEIEEKISNFPVPPLGKKASMPQLEFTSLVTQNVSPVEAVPPALSLSSIHKEELEPKAEPVLTPPVPKLNISGINAEVVDPKADPEPEPVPLSMSAIQSEALDPRAEPEVLPPLPELTVSRMHTQSLEPDETPLDTLAIALGLSHRGPGEADAAASAPNLAMASIESKSVDPEPEPYVAPPMPALSMAVIHSETVEPKMERETIPELTMTTINAQDLEPVATPDIVPDLGMASISSQSWEPVVEPPVIPELSMAGISSQGYEPVAEEVIPPALKMASISAQVLEPISEPEPSVPSPPSLGFSTVRSEHIRPVQERTPSPPLLTTSSIRSEAVTPVQPPSPLQARPEFAFTSIQSLETQPVYSRSPKREAFIIPQDPESPFEEIRKPKTGFVRGSVLGWDNLRSPTPPIIAEDDTRQSPRQSPQPETPESQRPLRAMSANTDARPRRSRNVTLDSSAQTSLTSNALDQMMQARQTQQPVFGHERQDSANSSMGGVGLRMRPGSEDSTGSVVRHRSRGADPAELYRPVSASSKTPTEDMPPLPANHREVIEAARTGSSRGGDGSMGPPLWPASATRNNRPRTPSISKQPSSIGEPTPRAVPARAGTAPLLSSAFQAPSRYISGGQASVSSFASELDTRFNMPGAGAGMMAGGFGPNTDPRMIQAITQTMIGEFLWKYTRKTGRGEMSENRHRRYFWVHPYTRTLYWSDRDPTTVGQRSELRAKSIPIEAVRVVTDDNPMPPGLPRKSLVVISSGRTVKFTCTTGQRHETWFNALSYLLLRTTEDGQSDVESMAEHITTQDVDEFNPQFGQRIRAPSRHTQRPSLSSVSRSIRNESPAMDMSMNIPTLTAARRGTPPPPRPTPPPRSTTPLQRPASTLTRLSGYWKPGQAFNSLRSRRNVVTPDIYENSEVHDSAEDVRVMIERQDREADRLENVRACCDGKHDVATLTRGQRPRPRLSHGHPGSTSATPMSSLRSRV